MAAPTKGVMNLAHLHVVINEVPLWAAIFAALLFVVAATTMERENWVRAGLLLLTISALATAVAFVSGIPAVDVVARLPSTSVKALSRHRERAAITGAFALVSAIVAATAFSRGRTRDEPFSRVTILVLMSTSTLQAICLAWTASEGWRVNHPEFQEAGDFRKSGLSPH